MTNEELEARYRRLQKKVREYRQEAVRCREMVKILAEARGTKAVMAGIYKNPKLKGGVLMFVCAPGLNERIYSQALILMLKDVLINDYGVPKDDLVTTDLGVTGTEADSEDNDDQP